MQVRIIATTSQQKSPVALLLKGELIQKLKVSRTQMNAYLQDGMPHYLIGNEFRFLESEIRTWLETYKPSQERLESEFRDKKGRTLEEYVTEKIIVETLRITKEKLVGLCKKEMPYERVGEKDFFHVQDILDYYRQGAATGTEKARPQSSKNTTKIMQPSQNSKKSFLMPLCQKVPKEVPFIIIDGSYDFKNHFAGSGLVLVENWDKATSFSNVRKIETTKSIVSEYLALLDALHVIKDQNINKAVIVTDQQAWAKGISINAKNFEETFKPYIKQFNKLWAELKGKVKVKFVGELTSGKKNALYKKAHKLSQEHKKGTYEIIEI
ncbi:reverse transcriptase-like protein [Neobacillus sp. PS2-9]|uniref:reverse transcriptase-like protein n=1 Tax=Neobacillus sp. PS2-9 TaxID=3070676 RepID=UPI0027E0C8E7|nr:reverse transcriptase-like protein [Neobacillus sp. PS2-9]WML58816.1 reverse transcriptase-like protein [Neobacillus sp. PS2-9]